MLRNRIVFNGDIIWSEDSLVLIKDWLINNLSRKGYTVKRLTYNFIDKKAMRELNQKSLDHDYVTDIISFDYSEKVNLKAEFYVCEPWIRTNAKDWGLVPGDEVLRVLAHGLLHCIGFDDKDEGSQQIMRREEDFWLNSRPKSLKTK
jgi:rRNA maturation RNase YbeY